MTPTEKDVIRALTQLNDWASLLQVAKYLDTQMPPISTTAGHLHKLIGRDVVECMEGGDFLAYRLVPKPKGRLQ